MNSKHVAAITLNVAYDLMGFCPEIELGEMNRVQTIGLYAAGKGINVAKLLRSLDVDVDVTVGGFLGQDNSEGFLQLFSELNLTNRFQLVEGRNRLNIKLTEKKGDVTDLNFSGLNINPVDWQQFSMESLSWLSAVDMVVVSGSLPLGVTPEAFRDWLVQLKKYCPQIILDSSDAALTMGLKALPWLVKPNLRELETWVGHRLPTQHAVLEAAYLLQKKGIAHVVVSLGGEGALWVNDSGIWYAKPPKCEVVSTVGAGDSMVGGMVYGLLMGQSSEQILRLATAIAALTVSQGRVGMIESAELKTMMARIDVRKLNY